VGLAMKCLTGIIQLFNTPYYSKVLDSAKQRLRINALRHWLRNHEIKTVHYKHNVICIDHLKCISQNIYYFFLKFYHNAWLMEKGIGDERSNVLFSSIFWKKSI
jgi:deoxyribodipyrimidine photolyase